MEIQSVAGAAQMLTSSANTQSEVSRTTSHDTTASTAVKTQPEKAATAVGGKQGSVDHHALQNAVDQANETIHNLSNELQFSVDKGTGEYVVKVVDKQTNEVVRQIPSKEMLEIAKRLDELRGLLVQQKA